MEKQPRENIEQTLTTKSFEIKKIISKCDLWFCRTDYSSLQQQSTERPSEEL